MKKTKMKFLKTLTFLFIFSLFSCSEDLYETESNKSNYKVSYVNSVAIQNNKELVKTLRDKKIIKPNSLNKIVIDTVNNFSIDTDFVKFLQGPNFNSYTFKVIEQEENYLDNLVLVSRANAPYSAFIMRYNLTEQEKTALNNGQTVDFTNKAKVLKLSNSNIANDALGKLIYYEECNWVTTWEEVVTITPCPIDGCWSSEWTGTSVSHVLVGSWVCTGGGGGSELGDVGTSPHGGGGGGSDLTPPDPCVNLKKHLSATTGIKLKSPAILPFLNGQLSQPKEYGFYFKKENNVYTPYQSYNATTDKITMKVGENYFCSIHTHPYPTGNPMFSWEDVYTLQQTFQYATQELTEEVTVYLVCTDNYGANQLYALKIEDFSTFSDFIVDDISNTVTPQDLAGLTTDEDRAKEILRIMNAKQHKYNLKNPNMNQEIPFLNYFAGSGASLYKANGTLTNWDKITLSNNPTNPITKTPCN